MKRFVALVVFAACAASVAGCGMMKGAGEDMEEAGKNIQKSATR